eukprot:1192750-Prorocentrum_minimum.AAC.3
MEARSSEKEEEEGGASPDEFRVKTLDGICGCCGSYTERGSTSSGEPGQQSWGQEVAGCRTVEPHANKKSRSVTRFDTCYCFSVAWGEIARGKLEDLSKSNLSKSNNPGRRFWGGHSLGELLSVIENDLLLLVWTVGRTLGCGPQPPCPVFRVKDSQGSFSSAPANLVLDLQPGGLAPKFPKVVKLGATNLHTKYKGQMSKFAPQYVNSIMPL